MTHCDQHQGGHYLSSSYWKHTRSKDYQDLVIVHLDLVIVLVNITKSKSLDLVVIVHCVWAPVCAPGRALQSKWLLHSSPPLVIGQLIIIAIIVIITIGIINPIHLMMNRWADAAGDDNCNNNDNGNANYDEYEYL